MNPLRALANLASAWVDAIAQDRIVYPAKPFDVHADEALAVVATCGHQWCDSPRDGCYPVCRTHRVIASACLRVMQVEHEDVDEWDREIGAVQ